MSAGAHTDGSGATLLARAGSVAEVEELLARDPFVVQGLATWRVVGWDPVLGAFS